MEEGEQQRPEEARRRPPRFGESLQVSGPRLLLLFIMQGLIVLFLIKTKTNAVKNLHPFQSIVLLEKYSIEFSIVFRNG